MVLQKFTAQQRDRLLERKNIKKIREIIVFVNKKIPKY